MKVTQVPDKRDNERCRRTQGGRRNEKSPQRWDRRETGLLLCGRNTCMFLPHSVFNFWNLACNGISFLLIVVLVEGLSSTHTLSLNMNLFSWCEQENHIPLPKCTSHWNYPVEGVPDNVTMLGNGFIHWKAQFCKPSKWNWQPYGKDFRMETWGMLTSVQCCGGSCSSLHSCFSR